MNKNVLQPERAISSTTNNLADILERVLDKGIVITGDIRIQLADIDLINIKIRLLITSVDKAKEIGIDWWEKDPFLSTKVQTDVEKEQKKINQRLSNLEKRLPAPRQNRRR